MFRWFIIQILSVARRITVPILLAAQLLCLLTPSGWALEEDTEEEAAQTQKGFQFTLHSSEMLEVLDDFDRYCDRGDWDRAFKNLEQLQKADRTKLLRDKQGFVRPISARLQLSLSKLKPGGRAAFRLFYDAEAKRRLADATGPDELAKLTEVFDRYFISSLGDVAADRLGDLYFERGQMAEAASCWEAVLRDHPDSSIPRLRLLTKAALACARAGSLQRFDELRQLIAERYADQTVELGGRKVDAAAHLASLAASLPRESNRLAMAADLELPNSNDLLWKFNLYSADDRQRLESLGNGWNMRLPILSSIPPVALDGTKCYVDVLGTEFAIDLVTGKLLWRTGKIEKALKAVQQNPYGPYQSSNIAAADGRVWGVAGDPAQFMQEMATRIWCREAAGGPFAREHNDKVVWESKGKPELAKWHPVGRPLPVGNRLFVCAATQEKPAELYALGIAADTGKLLWSTALGTRAVNHQGGMFQHRPEPCLLLNDESLFVETHEGGLVRLNAQTGQLMWGFEYESRVLDPNNFWNAEMTELVTASPPRIHDGVLYFKGMRSSRLHAIGLTSNQLLWRRPVAESAALISVDSQQILLSGEELISLDAKTQKLRWARRLPSSSTGTQPWVTEHFVYDFTARGIFQFDRATGDTFRVFRGGDLDSMGGQVYVSGPALVTVSNLAIAAYPLKYREVPAHAAPSSSRQP